MVVDVLTEKGVVKMYQQKRTVTTKVWSVGAVALLIVAFMVLTTSYFNTKEIKLASEGCYEVGGSIVLEIHNSMTSSYSFECKK